MKASPVNGTNENEADGQKDFAVPDSMAPKRLQRARTHMS